MFEYDGAFRIATTVSQYSQFIIEIESRQIVTCHIQFSYKCFAQFTLCRTSYHVNETIENSGFVVRWHVEINSSKIKWVMQSVFWLEEIIWTHRLHIHSSQSSSSRKLNFLLNICLRWVPPSRYWIANSPRLLRTLRIQLMNGMGSVFTNPFASHANDRMKIHL